MGSSLIVGLKTRLATSRSTKQDVWRGRCCACLRQWLRHVQGRLRRRRRPQGRLPLHRWTSPPPGCHGRYGTEGRLRRRRGPVQERHPHPQVPRGARNHHQLGRHGEDLAPHLLQRAPRCPRGAARPPDRGPPQPQGQQGEDDPDHVRDLQHARHVRRHPGCALPVRLRPYHRLLNETKDAFIGYAENNETIANEVDIAEEEIKKVKKIFNLESANADLKKRQDLFKRSDETINGLFNSINANMATMSITIPEDKKKVLTKEIKAVEDKLEVVGRFKATVSKIEDLVSSLTSFDNSLKAIDGWMQTATAELTDIKEASGAMLPEDRVARTMDLQEDIAAKLEILKTCAA